MWCLCMRSFERCTHSGLVMMLGVFLTTGRAQEESEGGFNLRACVHGRISGVVPGGAYLWRVAGPGGEAVSCELIVAVL
jgi:hypothetical protein